MKVELMWVAAAIAGVLLRQIIGFQGALAGFANRMAELEKRSIPPITYQNSITPPWVSMLFLVLLLAIVSLIVATGYLSGWLSAAISLGATVGAMVISGGLSAAFGRPTMATYWQLAFRALAHRTANYRRRGDAMRAEAAEQFCVLLFAIEKEREAAPEVQS